jgi:hypothetical protein
MAVDTSGNIYVTGGSTGEGSDLDYATTKYNSAGQQQWVVRYNGPGNSTDVALAIAVDGVGNVYVAGTSVGSDIFGDYATIKYNSAGQEQWVARYDGPGHGVDDGAAVAVDVSGNVYVTGDSYGLANSDYVTIKYNWAGQEQWIARYDTNFDDYGRAIAFDRSGNVYVTGSSWGEGHGYDYATVKYNATGQQEWVARYRGPIGPSQAAAIAVDDSSHIYVTGSDNGSGTYSDYATVKYNAIGQQEWVARYNGSANGDDGASAMAVDRSGNVHVTGGSSGGYGTVKYNSAGQEQWVARYNGPGNANDQPGAIAVDGSGDVYVTGFSGGSGTFADYATIKYVQEATPTPTPRATPRPRPTPHPRPTPP